MSRSYPPPALDPELFSSEKAALSQRPASDINSVRKSTLLAGCSFHLRPITRVQNRLNLPGEMASVGLRQRVA